MPSAPRVVVCRKTGTADHSATNPNSEEVPNPDVQAGAPPIALVKSEEKT
jgi:hypothetical protein